MFNIGFWGGPRDGDTVHQIATPCEHYYVAVDPPSAIVENLKTPVTECVLMLVESHHYTLRWDGELDCTYVYNGVVNKGK